MTDRSRHWIATADASGVPNGSWDGPVSVDVLTAVADLEGVNPADLPPLRDVVDVDAIDALFDSRDDAASRGPGYVSFRYEGYSITIYHDGEFVVRAITES